MANKKWFSLGEIKSHISELNGHKLHAVLIYEGEYDLGISKNLKPFVNTIAHVFVDGTDSLAEYKEMCECYECVELVSADNIDDLFYKIDNLNNKYYKNEDFPIYS